MLALALPPTSPLPRPAHAFAPPHPTPPHPARTSQVFEYVLYESWEANLAARFPHARWLHKQHTSSFDGRMVLVPSRLCMILVRRVHGWRDQ